MSKQDPSIAWQKWQPQQFAEPGQQAITVPADPLPISAPETTAPLDAQQEIEAFRASVRDNAWEEGYAAGKAEGEREGLQQGTQQALERATVQQQQALASIEKLVQQVTLSFDLLEETVSYRLVQLALEIAHQLTGEEVSHDARMVMTQVKQLLAQETLLTGTLTLKINPQDHQFLQGQLSTLTEHPRWEVVVDSTLPRGDCRLVSDEGELESALSTRWQSLCELAQQGAY
ncbi:flagellar assembly protein FliH [Rosenbergiella sp. S61]|uniref:Flagellar assembly protein FliH n=1 Tax=Rosenbergiella gaditana TaxID=2726987 RepID=A0ABS5SSC7_9GAMM|nr:flagellar assembly protein FliH [Rosenbergiella gaditana]MBT0722887.1 flagellar assembly protein FliH [Rosenbergiella gaditana]